MVTLCYLEHCSPRAMGTVCKLPDEPEGRREQQKNTLPPRTQSGKVVVKVS